MPRIPDFSPAELQTRARADLQRFAVTQAAYARATQAAMPPGGGDATSRFLGQFRDEAQAMAARWSPDVRQRLAWRIDELGSELTGPLAEAEAGERRRYHVERQDAHDAELLRTIAEHPDAAMRDAAEQQLTGAVPASPDLPQAAWDSRRKALPDRLAAAKGAAILADPEARRAIWQRPSAAGEAGPGDAGSPDGAADAPPTSVPTAIDPATLADGGHGHAGAWFRTRYPDASDAVMRKFAGGAVQRHGEDRDRAAAERDAVMGLVAPDYLSILTTGQGHPDLTPNRILKSLDPGLAKLVFEGQRKAGERYVASLRAAPAGGMPSEVPVADRRPPQDLAGAGPSGEAAGSLASPQAGAAAPSGPGQDGPVATQPWLLPMSATLPAKPAGTSAADPDPALPPGAPPARDEPARPAAPQPVSAPGDTQAPAVASSEKAGADVDEAAPPDPQPVDSGDPLPILDWNEVVAERPSTLARMADPPLRDNIRELMEIADEEPSRLRRAFAYAVNVAFIKGDASYLRYLSELVSKRGLDTTEIDAAAEIVAKLVKRRSGGSRSLANDFVISAARQEISVAPQIVELEYAAERGDAARAAKLASIIATVRGETGETAGSQLDLGMRGTLAGAYLGPAVQAYENLQQQKHDTWAAQVYDEVSRAPTIAERWSALQRLGVFTTVDASGFLGGLGGGGGGGGRGGGPRFRGGGIQGSPPSKDGPEISKPGGKAPPPPEAQSSQAPPGATPPRVSARDPTRYGPPRPGLPIPQGFTTTTFDRLSGRLRAAIGAKGYGDDIFVMGSRAGGKAQPYNDFDFGIRVSPERFDELIAQSFPRAITGKIGTREISIRDGRIQTGEAKLRPIRRIIAETLGVPEDKIQIAIIRAGGEFDNGPQTPLAFGF
ncbi:hypothetical protein [Labrys wisconsinensis]|uniref:Polymerase nucleotidyl transferase domain-containing protein n=1 Tax=Labrys wisconsinensis TaxID=425677 RepID=A0ABU0J4E0_9HYPH|nr:hypothetical protein [Labrys wisconsinensis]MDQ0468047.1 hypothetical protein [Labrys wisconsinensis]